jgi:hypothetical protein
MLLLFGVQLVVVIVDLSITIIDFVSYLELKLFKDSFVFLVLPGVEFVVLE